MHARVQLTCVFIFGQGGLGGTHSTIFTLEPFVRPNLPCQLNKSMKTQHAAIRRIGLVVMRKIPLT